MSQEYDKYRIVQYKNREATLPKITSPAIIDICEAEYPDDTSPVEMEEGLNDINDEKKGKNDEEREAECPDETSPVEMEEGVNDRKYENNENNDEGERGRMPR